MVGHSRPEVLHQSPPQNFGFGTNCGEPVLLEMPALAALEWLKDESNTWRRIGQVEIMPSTN